MSRESGQSRTCSSELKSLSRRRRFNLQRSTRSNPSDLNLSDQREVKECLKNRSSVTLRFKYAFTYLIQPLSEVFPDEDFCIYDDFCKFPFDRRLYNIKLRMYISMANSLLQLLQCWLFRV